MNEYEISPADVKPHPNNPSWTMPKTWGVWKLPEGAAGKKYRMGNNPIREKELNIEFGGSHLLVLYTSRIKAKEHADELNQK